jgi:hypothetical protein
MSGGNRTFRREAAREAGELGVGAVTWLFGLVLAALPPAWWFRHVRRGEVHAARAAAVSSLLQATLGAALFLGGMILWMMGLGEEIDAVARAGDDRLRDTMVGHLSLMLSPILPFIYALTTWSGFLSTLVLLGGVVRAVHLGVTREGMADPTLALVEAVRSRLARRVAFRRRERSKGERTPDRLFAADGSAGYHLRLLTPDDHAWREGADVFIDGVPWRLLARREVRDRAGRLRLQYDFRKLAGAEAVRGRYVYAPAVPPLRHGDGTA